MTVFKSAYENYTGKREDSGILKKLENRFRGYREIKLNLLDFINHNRLDMILNNNLITDPKLYFELYNYYSQLELEKELIETEIKRELDNYFKKGEINDCGELIDCLDYYDYEVGDIIKLDLDLSNFEDYIDEKALDSMYEGEVYQYFIVPENQVELWEEYTHYPIFYEDELDIYLLGITHYGMSWKYFNTTYTVREYLD